MTKEELIEELLDLGYKKVGGKTYRLHIIEGIGKNGRTISNSYEFKFNKTCLHYIHSFRTSLIPIDMPIEIKMDYDELSKAEDFDELMEVFDEDEDKSNRELFREIVGENIENAKLEDFIK